MKCVHCGYESKWNSNGEAEGEKGGFYVTVHVMKKKRRGYDNDIQDIYGCPKCKKIFIA